MRSVVTVKLPRTGLGNRLLPWARAVSFSARNNYRMLDPFWPQLKVGPLLRGERDARIYASEFRNLPGIVDVLQSRISHLFLKVELDPQLKEARHHDGRLYVFSSYEKYFKGLEPDHELISNSLSDLLTSTRRHEIDCAPKPDIAIHVRRGDLPSSWQSKTAWFQETLRALRRERSDLKDAVVFSDAAEHELGPLLAEPDVTLSRGSSAIVDLLTMSKAEVLVGSCHSSFSAWASFLGKMPTIVDSKRAYDTFCLSNSSFSVREYLGRGPIWPDKSETLDEQRE